MSTYLLASSIFPTRGEVSNAPEFVLRWECDTRTSTIRHYSCACSASSAPTGRIASVPPGVELSELADGKRAGRMRLISLSPDKLQRPVVSTRRSIGQRVRKFHHAIVTESPIPIGGGRSRRCPSSQPKECHWRFNERTIDSSQASPHLDFEFLSRINSESGEKFFITFIESPSRWIRVTVSVDYRNAPVHSLEAELCTTLSQRDKTTKIYQAIRDRLMSVEFYDSVTALRIRTTDGRLHVSVAEDLEVRSPFR